MKQANNTEQTSEGLTGLFKSLGFDIVDNRKAHKATSLIVTETEFATCICQQADTPVCDHNWSLCNVIRERLEAHKEVKQDE